MKSFISENQLYEFYIILKNHFENESFVEDTPSSSGVDFLKYLNDRILEYQKIGNRSAVDKICTTRSRFYHFLKKEKCLQHGKLPFNNITQSVMKKFESFLKAEMLSMNTISFYMRILRTYYNKALSDGIATVNNYPFQKVYTGIPKTKKRAVDIDVIADVTSAPLPKKLEMARDLFLFSFYTRGMPFVDIAHLEKKNIRGDKIKYFRQKTGQEITVSLEPCMMDIINKYSSRSGTENIFPVLFRNRKPIDYYSAIRKHNRHLEEISEIIGLERPLSSYVARHTWASIAKQAGVPVLTISESMGHTSEKTTQIYLDSFNQNTLDEANRLVIKSISVESSPSLLKREFFNEI